MRTSGLFATLATAALLSCGGNDPAFERMVGEHALRVEEIRSANEAHRSSLATAVDLSRVQEIEARHGDEMAGPMSGMQAVLEQMKGCAQLCCVDGARMMSGLQDEMDHHRGSMDDGMASMDAARAEEDRHQGRMGEELSGLELDHASMTHMMGMGMSMGCAASAE